MNTEWDVLDVTIPPVHTDHEDILSYSPYSGSDGSQHLQSLLCAKIYSKFVFKVNMRLQKW